VLSRFERYTNNDVTNNPVVVQVPVSDGELIVNNNLAFNSETVVVDPNDSSKLTYNFKGGLPSVAPPFYHQ
jgi:hypothetical protein